MSEIILSQAYDILIMCGAGMTVMLVHDILECYQEIKCPQKVVAFLQDILFWIFSGLLTSSFLYYCSYGLVSFHAMGAFCVGGLLWKLCFTSQIQGFLRKVYAIMKKSLGVGK